MSACQRWFLAAGAGRSVDCCYNCSSPAPCSHNPSPVSTPIIHNIRQHHHRTAAAIWRHLTALRNVFSLGQHQHHSISNSNSSSGVSTALEIMSTSSIKYLRLTLTGYNLHQLGVLTHLCAPCIHALRLLSISCHKISSKKLLITMGTGQQQWCAVCGV